MDLNSNASSVQGIGGFAYGRNLRVGLLGAGVISAPHILALRGRSDVEIAAICDLDRRKAESVAQQSNIPKVYDLLDAMLSQERLDVVHILLPPAAHAATAVSCLEAGAHLFVEKPFCLTSSECARVLNAAAQANRQVGVNHNLTFMPGIVTLIGAIRDLKLGAVEHVTVVYNLLMPALAAGLHGHWMFGGRERLILELGPHPLSVVYRLLGRVRSASTAVSGHAILNNGEPFFDTWQSSLVCDRGTAQVVLAVGREHTSTWVHVIGQDGEAMVDLRRNTFRLSEKTKFQRSDNLLDGWRNSRRVLGASIRNFKSYLMSTTGFGPTSELQNISMNGSVNAFYHALKAGREVPVSGIAGTAVVDACESVIESGLRFAELRGGHSDVVCR
jgi:predicted dehydrogenase